MDKERSKHQERLNEVRDTYEKGLTQLREDIQAEKQGHHHLQSALHKIKKVSSDYYHQGIFFIIRLWFSLLVSICNAVYSWPRILSRN